VGASLSDLSSSKYGYDYVVATTQASINSGLLQYLANANEPTSYLCFLADDKGNPTTEVTLDQLMSQTGGVNPFEIPDGTSYDDERITTLTKNMFVAGVQVKLGLPPGIMPTDLPPVVDLGTSASSVTFNLLCSEFTVIQNSPPSGFGGSGSWSVWSQPSGQAWYFSTTVDLVFSGLDSLNTTYFKNHPDQQKALLAQLDNLSGSAFSLQQLLFDLDNAAVQSMPTISGLPAGSDAAAVLTKSFLGVYFTAMKNYGEPLIAVHAVVDTPDFASLQLTGVEREVNPFVDANGVPVDGPTPEQLQAVTLDYLCAANNDPLPGASGFSWNWVDPDQVGDLSGIVSVNRKTLAAWLYQQLGPTISRACLEPWTGITSIDAIGDVTFPNPPATITPGQMPQTVAYPDTGDIVLSIKYASDADASKKNAAAYFEFDIHSNYECDASFSGNTITVVQHLVLWLKVQWADTAASGNVVDVTLTDTYTLSVDQNGELQVAVTSASVDNSQNIDLSGFVNFFVTLNPIIDEIKGWLSAVATAELTELPLSSLQSFVFPGANVFTFKDVQFSDSGDLVTSITYAQPS
jgi:hypothetical protein